MNTVRFSATTGLDLERLAGARLVGLRLIALRLVVLRLVVVRLVALRFVTLRFVATRFVLRLVGVRLVALRLDGLRLVEVRLVVLRLGIGLELLEVVAGLTFTLVTSGRGVGDLVFVQIVNQGRRFGSEARNLLRP